MPLLVVLGTVAGLSGRLHQEDYSTAHSAQHSMHAVVHGADISVVLEPGHGTAAGGVGTCWDRACRNSPGEESELSLWGPGICKGPALNGTDRLCGPTNDCRAVGAAGHALCCVCFFLPRRRVPLDWRRGGLLGGCSEASLCTVITRGSGRALGSPWAILGPSLRPRKRSGA